ncbi:hypothetical protein Mkiyose1665_36550 [Mycobacterium kiyosense]|nr:hypothetical protein Mkiyose1665_36550 [Mycobacterium kiyosense]
MVAQDGQVDHVGIGKQPPRPFPGEAAHFGGAVAVIGGGRHVGEFSTGDQGMCRAQLVVAQRLGRRQVQHPGARVACQRGQHRQLVGQGLARRGAGADHHVAAGVPEFGRLQLMGPGGSDAAIGERANDPGRNPVRPITRPARPGRQLGDVAQRPFPGRGTGERGGE